MRILFRSYKQYTSRLADNLLFRYIGVGVIAYIIEIASLYALKTFSLNDTQAVAISFWIGLTVSFLLQKVVAFKDTHQGKKVIATQSLKYLTLVALNYSFTLLFVAMTGPTLGVYISRTIALGITTAWNFIVYKKVIFKS